VVTPITLSTTFAQSAVGDNCADAVADRNTRVANESMAFLIIISSVGWLRVYIAATISWAVKSKARPKACFVRPWVGDGQIFVAAMTRTGHVDQRLPAIRRGLMPRTSCAALSV
jgi:hypothetical protein